MRARVPLYKLELWQKKLKELRQNQSSVPLDFLQRCGKVAKLHHRPGHRRGPLHRVADNALHFRLVIDRVGLVAGAEIEDFTTPPVKAAAAAEDLAALKPTDKHQRIGRGDVKMLTVHLGLRDFKIFAQSGGNRMARLDHPETFFFTQFSPL